VYRQQLRAHSVSATRLKAKNSSYRGNTTRRSGILHYCGHGRPSQLLLSSCYINFWVTVCKTVRPCYRTVVWLSRPVRCASLWRWCMWPSGSMDPDATWHGGRPRLKPHRVIGDPALTERDTAALTHFSVHFALARSPISATAEPLLKTRQHSQP